MFKFFLKKRFIIYFFVLFNATFSEAISNEIGSTESQQIPIYIYTDFGGGKSPHTPASDEQTKGELASEAFSSVGKKELFINDSATPLAPDHAAAVLGITFPYTKDVLSDKIKQIVVHVIDPGVENDTGDKSHHLRSAVLRKDGTLFIGPDNGSLTCVCPKNSIASIWKIEMDKLRTYSNIDLTAGGTFHGRDLFLETAVHIAKGSFKLSDVCTPYSEKEIQNRLAKSKIQKLIYQLKKRKITFEKVRTDYWEKTWPSDEDENQNFERAYLLQIIQSPRFQNNPGHTKIFYVKTTKPLLTIAVINQKTRNVFVGPNNGLATSFFADFNQEDIVIKEVSWDWIKKLKDFKSTEEAYIALLSEKALKSPLVKIPFYGQQSDVLIDKNNCPRAIHGRIWIDAYGNIKTTIRSDVLFNIWNKRHPLTAEINGIKKEIKFAKAFTEVKEGELFIYPGSTAASGPNPARSIRYIEISANGVFGKFGDDFFTKGSDKPKSGQSITLWLK